MTKYYSTQRPLTPGSFPRDGVIMVTNYDEKRFCEEIGREAWGYVTYAGTLDPNAAKAYELIREGTKKWWCVTSAFYDDGHTTAAITDMIESDTQPLREAKSTARKDIYLEWFPSEAEAQKYVEDCRKENSVRED